MPYRPSKEQKAKNHAYWVEQRGLSDEEMFGADGQGLTDEEMFGASDGMDHELHDREREAAQALNVWDTATLGFGDEAIGGLSALGKLVTSGGDTAAASKAYDDEVKYARDLQRRYHEQPDTTWGDVASTGLGLVAGAPGAVGLFKAAGIGSKAARGLLGMSPAATSVTGKVVQGAADLAAAGALGSGVYETGSAEGSLPERLGNVSGTGLAIGAVAGPVLGAAGIGGVRIASAARNALQPYERQAARYIAERLGSTKPGQWAAEHAEALKTGKPVVLGDVGPQGIKDTAASVGRQPGPGREVAQEVIGGRQEGQVARVSDDVAEAVGGKPGSFTQTIEQVTADQQAAAKPLYDRAFAVNKPVVSPKIIEITNRPSGKAALDRGLRIARDEGIPDDELIIRDAQGNVTGYTTKALHYMKLGLDDMIESAQRSGDGSAARALTIMKRELLGELDAVNPHYAAARKAFAGPAAQKRALEMGREAHLKHPDQIRSELSELTPGEQEMYRRGFAQRIIEEVERSPDQGNAVNRIFGNTAKRERLRAALGDEEYNRLAQRLGVENAMYGTFKSTNVGSATAERVSQDSDVNTSALGEFAPALAEVSLTGNVGSFFRRLGMGRMVDLLRRINAGRRGEIAKMLFSRDPKQVRAAVKMIEEEYAAIARRDALAEMGAAIAAERPDAQAVTAGTMQSYGYSPVQPY